MDGVGISADIQPRIEVYEDGRRVPAAPRPPVLSSAFLGEDVILERHSISQSAHYGEREQTTHTLFLYEGEPVRAAWRVDGKRLDAWVRSGHLWIVPRSMPHTSSFQGPHGGVLLSIGNSQLERLLRGLLAVAQDGSCANALVGELLVNAVCIHLATRYAAAKLQIVPYRGGLPAARLKRVLEYIDANLGKNIALFELASVVNMSLYHFAVLFRQSTGVSPHRYVLHQRVERAKGLLRDPKLSVLDVSINVGFGHPNNFARAFRRVIGPSPTQFRRDRLQLLIPKN